ncbi:hypothetical protein F5141DRAFT_1219366 [Pisolithus sp. B1]|nr:hypothetical protein F5141DRAFT_1219366 [Pisolithus sp. B1]
MATITTLHIDFDPDHHDILRQLHAVAPELTALKLIKKQCPTSLTGTVYSRANSFDINVPGTMPLHGVLTYLASPTFITFSYIHQPLW